MKPPTPKTELPTPTQLPKAVSRGPQVSISRTVDPFMAPKRKNHQAGLRLWTAVVLLAAGGGTCLLMQRNRPTADEALPDGGAVQTATTPANHSQSRQEALATPQTKAVSGEARTSASVADRDTERPLGRHRSAILNSAYGKAPIADVIRALGEPPGGPEIQSIFQALALRKEEALPIVQARLRTGEMWEKYMLTKFLRLCPWPETQPELLALATAKTEHWLPRQGALYALGSLGDAAAGPAAVAVLSAAESRDNLQMAALSTIARVGFRDGASAVSRFLENDNIHIRLFATRALAELGEPVNQEFLLAALQNTDYVVRQEAAETLWAVAGQDITEKLQTVAKNDFNEAVRDAAAQSLFRRELQGRNAAEKVVLLNSALDGTGRLTALWILRTMLEQGGAEGRAAVTQLASRDDRLGERARAYLIFTNGTGS